VTGVFAASAAASHAGSDPPRRVSDPLRVLLVAHHFPPHISGIGNVVAAEAQSLARRGNQVVVLTTTSKGGDGSPPTQHDFRIVRVPAWRGPEKWGVPFPVPSPSLLLTARRLARWADLVHVHDVFYIPTWAAVLAAQSASRPFIVTQHVSTIAHPSALVRSVQRIVYRAAGFPILRAAARVIVVNSRVEDFVVDNGVARNRVLLIPNGVDMLRFRPAQDGERAAIRARYGLPQKAVLALFVGRFVPKKGLGQLLAACDDAYTVVCVGGERPAGFPETRRARFLGALAQDQVAEVFRAADLFVLPSESEGFPLTAQEAMASGLPIVLRDDAGYAPYGLTSAGVRFVDGSPDTLRAVLRELAGNPGARVQLGQAALQYAQARFSWSDHAEQIENLCHAVLDAGR
jgi:glycosyltransferase involved in cell wall biosynthesis